MAEPVTETLCAERMKLQDERFRRDKERLDALEKTCKELEECTHQLSELCMKYDAVFKIQKEKEDEQDAQIKANDDRLTAIEQRPAKRWEDLSGAVLGAIGAGIGGCVLTLVVQALMQA